MRPPRLQIRTLMFLVALAALFLGGYALAVRNDDRENAHPAEPWAEAVPAPAPQ
jgi:hypothetical protein